MATRYPAPTGYAPAGVTYTSRYRRRRYPAPTGYAPAGVEYIPYARHRSPAAPPPAAPPPRQRASTAAPGTTNPPLPPGIDPYAPLSEDEITRRVRERIMASTDPVLAEITRSINANAERNIAGLKGFTEAQAAELGKAQGVTAGIYSRGAERASAVDSALAGQARGEGDASAAALASRLASVDAPNATGEQTSALTTAGQGSALAEYAGGSADLSALVARGTEEENLAAQYPRLARMVGIQGIREIERDASASIADQTGQVRAQIPGMIGDLEADYRTNELTKANARLARSTDERDYKEGKREFDLTLAENKRIRQAQLEAAGATAGAKVIADAAEAQRPDSALSRIYGHVVDSNGNAILQGGKVVPVAKAPKDQRRKIAVDLSKAYGYAVDAYGKPILDASGKRVPIKGTSTDKAGERAKALKSKSTATKTASDSAFARAREFYKGQTVTTAGGKLTPGTKTVQRKSWADAYRAIYAEISPQLLQRFAMKPAAVRAIVQDALIAAGYRPEGQAAPGTTTRRPDVGKPRGG